MTILVIALPESETSIVSEPPAQMEQEQAQSEVSEVRTEPEATALPTETPAPVPTETPAPVPTETPAAPDGSSPDLAIPFGQEVNIRDYSFIITEVERPADQTILAANRFNSRADPGNEMLLLHITITCTKDSSDTCRITPRDFQLFGSKGIIYEPERIVGLTGRLERTEFFGGRSIAGWMGFEVGEDETDLVLKFELFLSLTSPVYMALPEKE